MVKTFEKQVDSLKKRISKTQHALSKCEVKMKKEYNKLNPEVYTPRYSVIEDVFTSVSKISLNAFKRKHGKTYKHKATYKKNLKLLNDETQRIQDWLKSDTYLTWALIPTYKRLQEKLEEYTKRNIYVMGDAPYPNRIIIEGHPIRILKLIEGDDILFNEDYAEMEDAKRCYYCVKNLAIVRILPCGHVRTCISCVNKIRQGKNKCPWCYLTEIEIQDIELCYDFTKKEESPNKKQHL